MANVDEKGDNSTQNLGQRAGRGAFFQVTSGGVQTLIRIGASTILARVLLPSDFGLFGMALLMSELVLRIGALGMGVGIIAKKKVTDDDLSTAFWTMACIRLTIFSITFLSAPFLAGFFDEPRIITIIRVISCTFLFQIFGVIGNALLKKQLQFFYIFVITVSSSLLEVVIAITLVFTLVQSYWALVIAMVVASFWNNFLVFVLARWRPKFRFDKQSFRYLFRYGINSLGSSLTEYLGSNADYFIIGKLLGPKILGFYEFAYRIPFLIENRISIPLREIMFPALALANTSDRRLAEGYIKGVKYIALVCFPALGGLAVVADLMVRVLWGNQWLPIVVPLQILCLASAIKCTANPVRVVFNCKDRPDIPFKFSIILLIFTVIAVSSLGYLYGMIGVSWAMLLSTLPILLLVGFAFRMMQVSINDLALEIWPIFSATLFTIFSAYLSQLVFKMTPLPDVIILTLTIVAGILAYILSLRLCFRRTYQEVIDTLIQIMGKRRNKLFHTSK